MSLKQRGNEQVKKGNYFQAIKLYEQYVDQDHKDNDVAYTNMALCYFRLKDYRQSIKACEDSLCLNKQSPKTYYRLYLAYKQIPGQEYQTFINVHHFLKYYQDDDPKAKSEALAVMREFKEKFNKKDNSRGVKLDDDLISELQILGNDYIKDTVMQDEPEDLLKHWTSFFDAKLTREEKTEKVKEAIINQHEVGVDIGYLLLNTATKYENKQYISEQIVMAKKEYMQRNGIGEMSEEVEDRQAVVNGGEQDQPKNEMEDEADDENLFESEPEKPVKKQEIMKKNQAKQEKNEQKEPLPPKQLHNKIEKQAQKPPVQTKTVPNTTTSPPVKPQQPLKYFQSISVQFDNFMRGYKNSRDIFKDLSNIICRILQSDEIPKEGKQYYLRKIKGGCREAGLLKMSLPQREQRHIYNLLQKNDLDTEFDFVEPKAHWFI